VARNWPVIDVTHRSIEQVSAMIIDLLRARANDTPL
jgi:regulator of PEP synthase PpsR (kinase-PPPase family)